MVKKIEKIFGIENIIIKLGSSDTKEVKLSADDENIDLTIKGNINNELIGALGKYLRDESADITVSFSIPDKTQKSVTDF